MISAHRIGAIATKEWRLNSRFLVEYLAANLISPAKSAILMYLLYAGFLTSPEAKFGMLDSRNFTTFVLLGTTCHTVVMSSIYIFRTKMVMEKWWQTVTATLVSPASMVEVILGFMLGSGAIHLVIGGTFFALIAVVSGASAGAVGLSFLVLVLLSLLGFGIGLVGAAFSLCWEGKSWLYDYAIQLLVFLSCFYYPIETLPRFLHGAVQWLPTFQGSQLIQSLYLGAAPDSALVSLGFLAMTSVASVLLPAAFLEWALKRFGIVGY